jgi:ribosomal protein S18 acetylase RimI-like enzyme
MTDTRTVRRADAGDATPITEAMSEAFMHDPLSSWIFPDPAQRAHLHPRFFRYFVELTLVNGLAYISGGHIGVTLWFDINGDDTAGIAADEMHAYMNRELDSACTDRFFTLDELMRQNHPHDRQHAYLAFAAVSANHQGQGIGGRLIRHRLAELDAAGTPAYLEASCARNARLYERLGFTLIAPAIGLPDGPTIYPMWRPVATGATDPVGDKSG